MSILKFIYLGKARVSKSGVCKFLENAKDLQIEELSHTFTIQETILDQIESMNEIDSKDSFIGDITNQNLAIISPDPEEVNGSPKLTYKCK